MSKIESASFSNIIKDSSYIEDLVEIRENIAKNKEDNELLATLLKRFNQEIDHKKYSFNDLVSTKIGKSIKELASSSKLNNENKDLVKEAMEKMKKLALNTAKKDTNIKEKKENNNDTNENSKENNKVISTSEKKVLSNEEKKAFKDKVKMNIDSLKIANNPMRSNARSLLFEALLGKEQVIEKIGMVKTFTELIDNSVFDLLFSVEDKGSKYLSRVKSLVFNLSKGEEFRNKIFGGEFNFKELACMDVKEMAPLELKNKRSKTINDGFDSNRNDWGSKNATVVEGLYKCEECNSMKTSFFQMQIRGADEPMTSFITCTECKNQWTFN